MRAILSVWDKTGLVAFARGLEGLGWELYSSGGTQQALAAAGVAVRSVSDLTAFPELLDGRVKTLHPRLHAGILARRDVPAHLAQLAEHGVGPIDLVVSNLYPFVETIAARDVPAGALVADGSAPEAALPAHVLEAIEQIDVGGPALTRAAAKNFEHVVVVTDPADYPAVLDALRRGTVSRAMRAMLAQKAFAHTAQYDAYVSQYLAALNGDRFPAAIALPLSREVLLTYGENPHQEAALYRLADPRLTGETLAGVEQLKGEAVSYNNLLDLDNAYAIVAEFDEPAVAIVKHNNPCGAGIGATLAEAYRKAFQGDPLSAFGGVVAANQEVDLETARAMRPTLYWVLVAPGYSEPALRYLERNKKSLRVFRAPVPRPAGAVEGGAPGAILPVFALGYRQVRGGFLAQTRDAVLSSAVAFRQVSRRAPTEQELDDLRFAWRVVKHVKSNASVFARDGAIVGTGAGQMSRVDSVVAANHVARRSANRLAAGEDEGAGGAAARRPAAGCVMATDGFFAFPDAVEAAAEAGVTALAHPGGGKSDAEAAAAADRLGLAMVVTGYRHFRH